MPPSLPPPPLLLTSAPQEVTSWSEHVDGHVCDKVLVLAQAEDCRQVSIAHDGYSTAFIGVKLLVRHGRGRGGVEGVGRGGRRAWETGVGDGSGRRVEGGEAAETGGWGGGGAVEGKLTRTRRGGMRWHGVLA